MEKDTPCNYNHMRARIAIWISDKIDFKTINITRTKEENILTITGSILQEYIPIMHAQLEPNLNKEWVYMTQIVLVRFLQENKTNKTYIDRYERRFIIGIS